MDMDTKMRTQSVYKMINKRSVKAGRLLARSLEGKGDYTRAQILAAESLIRLYLPYDIGTPAKNDCRAQESPLNGIG